MKKITILLKGWIEYDFTWKYLPERQKDNWHYYEDDEWTIYHFRKSEMIAVLEYKF